MSENLYTVSNVLPGFYKNGGNTTELLMSVKETVRKAKEENPRLIGCHLQDVGFVQQDEGLEIKLYFAEAGLTT